MMIDLSGQNAVVTGGARGIGRAVSLMLAEAGANVAVGYLERRVDAEDVVERVRAIGRRALAFGGDVSDPGVLPAAIERIQVEIGPVSIGVANAGIWRRAPINAMSREQWDEMVAVNLSSVYELCRHLTPGMIQRKQGKLVLITSTAGQRGEAYYSHYAATKGGIIALTKSLAAELGPSGINVNAVAPGWVETEMVTEVAADAAAWDEIREAIPLKRIGQPEDIAGAVLYLVSSLARHVQGEVVNVNGGSVLCG